MLVSYSDAKVADPEYAALLAGKGVPTTEAMRQAVLLDFAAQPSQGAGVDPEPAPLPPPLAPQRGVAFGDERGGVEPRGGGRPGGKRGGIRGGSSSPGGGIGLALATPRIALALQRVFARRGR